MVATNTMRKGGTIPHATFVVCMQIPRQVCFSGHHVVQSIPLPRSLFFIINKVIWDAHHKLDIPRSVDH